MKAIATVGERLQLIKDWQCSGLTVSEWCRRNAYFSSMCYDPSGVHISGPVQHMISVDITDIPVFFLK